MKVLLAAVLFATSLFCACDRISQRIAPEAPRDISHDFPATKAEAERGVAENQYNLGVDYRDGDGVEKNPAEAVKWFRKAAEQGYADAQFELYLCYRDGAGVTRDPAEAMNWLRKAPAQGSKAAQAALNTPAQESA